MSVEITPAAVEQFKVFFEGKEQKPVRVFLQSGGCGGGSMIAMALDQINDTDEVFDFDGFQIVVEKDFLAQAQPLKIDFSGYGFSIDSPLDLPEPSGCSSCSGCH